MSKKNKKAEVVEIQAPVVDGANALLTETENEQVLTSKKYLKRMEKFARRLDNVLNDLNNLHVDIALFHNEVITTEIAEKDEHRLEEMEAVTDTTSVILFYVTERMARKYVGKTIESLEEPKRRPLKF